MASSLTRRAGCRRILFAAVIILSLIPCAVFVANFTSTHAIRKDIRNYKGDGEAKLSGTNFINYGYEVWFPSFVLSKDFTADYSVGSLPRIDKLISLQLRIVTDEATIEKFKTGELALELYSPTSGSIRAWTGR